VIIRLDPGFAARVLSHRFMGQNLGDHLALGFGPKAGSEPSRQKKILAMSKAPFSVSARQN